MRNVICIIARTNSKRLPHKTIREIAGKTMIEHIIDSMKTVPFVDEVYLCTSVDEEDRVLLDIAKRNGIKSYAGSRDSVINRILDVAEMENADNIIRVTGDNIFTDSGFLSYALKQHLDNDADYTRVERLPIGVTGEIMKVSAVKDCYNSIDPSQSEYLAVFMFNPEKYKCVTVLPPDKYNLSYNTLTVDTFNDWERTEFIFEQTQKRHVSFKDIYNLSQNKKIPFYDMDRNGLVKLPGDKTVTYEQFRLDYEERIEKSIHIQMSEEDYEIY